MSEEIQFIQGKTFCLKHIVKVKILDLFVV